MSIVLVTRKSETFTSFDSALRQSSEVANSGALPHIFCFPRGKQFRESIRTDLVGGPTARTHLIQYRPISTYKLSPDSHPDAKSVVLAESKLIAEWLRMNANL